MNKYNNIFDWLMSDTGKNTIKNDTPEMPALFQDMINYGSNLHNLQSSLQHVADALKEAGFGKVNIVDDGGISTFTFKPTDSTIHIADDECPSFEISKINGGIKLRNGLQTINNPLLVRGKNGGVGLASTQSTALDLMASEIKRYTDTWKDNVRDLNKRAGKISTTMRLAGESVTRLNPSMYSPSQVKEFDENFKSSDIANLALEAKEAMKGQILTSFYWHSLYQDHLNQFGTLSGFGAPKSEKALTRQLDGILNYARSCGSFSELNDYVKNNCQWIYNNIWKGDLDNLYKTVAGHITQNGKKEGASGILGTAEPYINLSDFTRGDRKPTQNLRYIHRDVSYRQPGSRDANYKSHASGYTRARTQKAYDLYTQNNENIERDIYYGGELNDEDLVKAYNTIFNVVQKMGVSDVKSGAKIDLGNGVSLDVSKIINPKGEFDDNKIEQELKKFKKNLTIQSAVKGFGKDASLFSVSAGVDFGGMVRQDILTDTVSQDTIKEIVINTIQHNLKNKHKDKTEEQLKLDAQKEYNRLANISSNDAKHQEDYDNYNKFVNDALRRYFGLVSKIKIDSWDLEKDENGNSVFSNIKLSEKLNNYNMVIRGGALSDLRSNMQSYDDLLLGTAFLNHGYRPIDIWNNGDPTQGLKMLYANQEEPLSDKNIQGHINRKAEYILNHDAHILQEMEKAKTGNSKFITYDREKDKYDLTGALKGIYTYDPNATTYDPNVKGKWTLAPGIGEDPSQISPLEKFYNSKGSKGTPFEFYNELIKFGQNIGVYETREGVNPYDIITKKDKDGKSVKYVRENFPLPEAYEIEAASVDRYQGGPEDTKSGMKISWAQMQSLEGQLGEMEYEAMHAKSEQEAEEIRRGIAPVRNLYNQLADQFAQKENDYGKYKRNLQYVARNTFTNDDERNFNNLKNDLGTAYVDLSNISNDEVQKILSLDTKLEYDKSGKFIGVKDAGAQAVESYLKEKRSEKYKQLIENRMHSNNEDEEAAKAWLRQNDIFDENDINVSFGFGDTGELSYTNDKGQGRKTNIVSALIGTMEKQEGSELLMPDSGATGNARLIGAIQDYLTAPAKDKERMSKIAAQRIDEIYNDYAQSVEREDIYNKYHTLSKNTGNFADSGYLLLNALGADSELLFKKLGFNEEETPNEIMSVEDARQLYLASFKDDEQKRQEIINDYERIFGKGSSLGKDGELKSATKIIGRLINHYDIRKNPNGNGKHETIKNMFIDRSPTIRFADDLMGGRLALSSDRRDVEKGSLSILKSKAAVGKGDMDGDRVAFYNALLKGEDEKALFYLNKYYDKLAKRQEEAELDSDQKAIKENGKELSELDKINRVADSKYKRSLQGITNSAAPGAGIYGDLLFGLQNAFRKAGVSQGQQGTTGFSAYTANIAERVAHALYQEGINIKKAKAGSSEAIKSVDELFRDTFRAESWTTEEGARRMLDKGINLGIFDKDGMFKPEIVGQLGLNDLSNVNDKGELQYADRVQGLLDIANRAVKVYKARYEVDTKNTANKASLDKIQKDIDTLEAIKKQAKDKDGNAIKLHNLSNELLIAILSDSQYGVKTFFKDESFDDIMRNIWHATPGKEDTYSGWVRAVMAMAPGEKEKQQFANLYSKTLAPRGGSTRYGEIIASNGLSDFTTSPTRRVSEVAHSLDFGENKDATDYFVKLVDQILETSDKDKKEELSQIPRSTINKEYKPQLSSLWGGTLSHTAAELYRNAVNSGMTPEYAEQFVLDNVGKYNSKNKFVWGGKTATDIGQIGRQTFKRYSQAFNASPKDATSFVIDAVRRGIENGKYVEDSIKSQHGTAIGNEMALAGFMRPDAKGKINLSRGYADYIYKTIDENGKSIIHVGDYKNVKGDVTAGNILQVKHYIDSLKLLRSDVLSHGYSSVDEFLGSTASDNEVSQGWERRLREAAEDDVKAEKKFLKPTEVADNATDKERAAYEKAKLKYEQAVGEAYKKRRAEFTILYKEVTGANVGFAGEMVSNNGAGLISKHKLVDLENDELNKLYEEKFLKSGTDSEVLTADEQKSLVSNPKVISKIDTKFANGLDGWKAALKTYEDQFQALKLIKDAIDKRKALLDKYDILIEAENRESNPNQAKIEDYRNKKKKIEDSLGKAGALQKFEDLQAEREELVKKGDTSAVMMKDREISELQGTDAYKYETAVDQLKENEITVNGKTIKITDDIIQAVLGSDEDYNSTVQQEGRSNTLLSYRLASEQYVHDIRRLNQVNKAIATNTNEAKSKFITEEQESDIQEQITDLVRERDRLFNNLTEILEIISDGSEVDENGKTTFKWKKITDEEGNLVQALNEDRLNSTHLKDEEQIKKEAQKKFTISEQQKELGYFNKAYNTYRQQTGLDDRIWELQQNIDNPMNASDVQVKIWESEITNLQKQRELMANMVSDIKTPENGYTEEMDKQAQEKARLESEMWRLQKSASMEGKMGYGSYGGFLGIDTSVMRWIDRLMSGGTFMTFLNQIKKGISDITTKAKQLDQSLTNLRIVTGDNASEAKTLVNQYADLAKQLGVTTTEAVNAAVEWSRQGYNTAEVQDLVKSSTYLSKLGMIDSTTAVKDLTIMLRYITNIYI